MSANFYSKGAWLGLLIWTKLEIVSSFWLDLMALAASFLSWVFCWVVRFDESRLRISCL